MQVSDYCPSCPSCPNPQKLKSNCSRMGSSILLRHLRIFSRSTTASAAPSSYVHQSFRAQRNAIESPLLRLPSEIRSIIWTFAVGVSLVHINCQSVYMRRQSNLPLRAIGYGVAFNERRIIVANNRQLSAFHLPEVCRQIYAETATLAYSTNTFLIGPYTSDWIRALSLTQRRAITRVELDCIYKYLEFFESRMGMASLKSKGLVRLTHCHVSISTQKQGMRRLRGEFLRFSKDRQSWVRLVTDAVRFQEGQHMVVEVE
jgi:hypothetical protein